MTSDTQLTLPKHVAIIMDGNNRWAKSQGQVSKFGHRKGAEAARDAVNFCIKNKISYLTLFAFSSENWLRPTDEVKGLMALFLSVLQRKEIIQFHEKNVRIRFIGNRLSFTPKLQSLLSEVESLTVNNTGVTVNVAADYGGRWDVVEAVKRIAQKIALSELNPDAITAGMLTSELSLSDIPDPDLCIRTGGECRISNFLLWQFAYTELYFTDCFWPDFGEKEFSSAISDYSSRQRRFGAHQGEGAH
jgi:undecaprenyl diphosphate synthase